MSQVAAEMLASIALQHRRRGDPHHIGLAEVCERMADRMQGNGLRHASQTPTHEKQAEPPPAARPFERSTAPCDERDVKSASIPPRKRKPCKPAESAILAAIRQRRRGNGISSQELGALAHITPRSARAIIAHLRADHSTPIAGTPEESYFWPATIEELNSTYASLQSRIVETQAAIFGMREGADKEFKTGLLPGMEP